MIQTVNTCVNCSNITDSLICTRHKVEVEVNNVCDDHNVKA